MKTFTHYEMTPVIANKRLNNNWANLSEIISLDSPLITVKPERIDWAVLLCRVDDRIEFIDRLAKVIPWGSFQIPPTCITDDFARKYRGFYDWQAPLFIRKLSDEILVEYANEINWTAPAPYLGRTLDFYSEVEDHINWSTYTGLYVAEPTMLIPYKENIDWDMYSQTVDVADIIPMFYKHVRWDIVNYSNASLAFLKETHKYIDHKVAAKNIPINTDIKEWVSEHYSDHERSIYLTRYEAATETTVLSKNIVTFEEEWYGLKSDDKLVLKADAVPVNNQYVLMLHNVKIDGEPHADIFVNNKENTDYLKGIYTSNGGSPLFYIRTEIIDNSFTVTITPASGTVVELDAYMNGRKEA